jgi:hypothetical protein
MGFGGLNDLDNGPALDGQPHAFCVQFLQETAAFELH